MGEALEKACDYNYGASGLPVVLVGFTGKQGDDIAFANINMLHRLLAEAVATKPTCLDGPELRFLRCEQGLTRTEMAKLLCLRVDAITRLEGFGFSNGRALGCDYMFRILALLHFGIPIPPVRNLVESGIRWDGNTTYYVDASDPENYRLIEGP